MLAEELVKHGMMEDALTLYQRSLTGIYAADPHLMLGLANAFLKRDGLRKLKKPWIA